MLGSNDYILHSFITLAVTSPYKGLINISWCLLKSFKTTNYVQILVTSRQRNCVFTLILLLLKGSPNENLYLFIWALPVWGGWSKPLPGWFVAPIFRRNVLVQTGICMILPENRCHRVPV